MRGILSDIEWLLIAPAMDPHPPSEGFADLPNNGVLQRLAVEQPAADQTPPLPLAWSVAQDQADCLDCVRSESRSANR